jgi:topoisomerase-4 subunit A
MIGFSIEYIDKLLAKYGEQYPRRTEIKTFSEVEVHKVALSNLTVGYDRDGGFLGHQVKANEQDSFSCSEYDKILMIGRDGVYRVINVSDKIFVGYDLLWVGKVDDKLLFNIVYRDGLANLSYIKRFKMPKFILEKEYRLFSEHKRSKILFLKTGKGLWVRNHFAPNKRAKRNFEDINLDECLIKGAAAKGKRVSSRVVRRVVETSPKEAVEDDKPLGLFDGEKKE